MKDYYLISTKFTLILLISNIKIMPKIIAILFLFVYIYGNIIHLNANTLQQGDLYENKNRNNTRVLTVWKN